MFTMALESDILDVQGGTAQEDIHMGVMAGTLDVIQRGYVGARAKDTTLCYDPKPNEKLEGLSLHIRYHKTTVEAVLEVGRLTVAGQTGTSSRTIRVEVGDEVRDIKDGKGYTFPIVSGLRQG